MQAIRVNQPGGPEALSYETIDDPTPAADEAVIRVEAIGVNYIDTYQRSGLYPLDPPFTLGMEGAGVVEAVGSDVSGLRCWRPRGACHATGFLRRATGCAQSRNSLSFRTPLTPARPLPPCCRA